MAFDRGQSRPALAEGESIPAISRTTEEKAAMPKILVPVDGSEYSSAAVREAIKSVTQAQEGEIHLLNVQAPIFPAVTMVYMPTDKIDTYYFDAGSKALEEAERLVQEAGVKYAAHRAVGAITETIVSKAEELGCDSIVMGTHGRGKIAEMLLGSIAQRVLLLASVPVTLVKPQLSLDMTGRVGAT
jgi:nucleotide-binding universal stress UspA family protein